MRPATNPPWWTPRLKREPAPLAMSPYGTFDTVMQTLFAQLRAGPYLLGDTMCAGDILWGHALGWGMQFGLVEKNTTVVDYVTRITQRPAALKAAEMDARLAAKQAYAID